jgi:hypothetical protein
MSALTILVIRHAEKPNATNGQQGFTEDGKMDEHSLIIRGWQRAGTWAALFGSGALAPDFPKVDHVYAANPNTPSPAGGAANDASKRPWQTVAPLCERLHIQAVAKYGVGDEASMIAEVLTLTGNVLIAWEHRRIVDAILPGLAKAKGQTIPNLPSDWRGSRFDAVLRFDCAPSSAPWTFRQLFPRLLAGDLDIPVESRLAGAG